MFSKYFSVLCIGIVLMPIRIRLSIDADPDSDPSPTSSYTEVVKSVIFAFTRSNTSFHCFIYLFSFTGDIIVSSLGSILKIFEQQSVVYLYIWLRWIKMLIRSRIRIQIGRPWMPMPIRQNDAVPTGFGSGFTTLIFLDRSLLASVVTGTILHIVQKFWVLFRLVSVREATEKTPLI